MNIIELNKNDVSERSWKNGSSFLWKLEHSWPRQPISFLSKDDVEIKTKNVLIGAVQLKPLEFLNHSRWCKPVHIMSWILRFYKNLTNKVKGHMLVIGESLHVKEMEEAERVIIKVVQSNYFNEEINCIRQGCELPRTTTKLLSLNPYLDDQGLLRVGERISNAHVPFSAKHQIIIPCKCHVAMLIIRQEHETCAHMGREYVLAAVRQKFWITNGRIIVKKVIKACFYCKKRNVEAMKPIMADLPEFRVEDSQPIFSNTGVDLFGPIYIKQRRARLKRWGSLFTCLNTRAVHLEVVESLETDSFINCLRRFTSRRGQPKLIISDCGSNFKGAANELKENLQALDQEKLSHYAQTKRFEWKFIPPSSPRMGGALERLIRTDKTALTTIMKDRVLTDFQLATIFCEVEYIVNSRPLTCVSDDPNDYEALTPNHFLLWKEFKG